MKIWRCNGLSSQHNLGKLSELTNQHHLQNLKLWYCDQKLIKSTQIQSDNFSLHFLNQICLKLNILLFWQHMPEMKIEINKTVNMDRKYTKINLITG